MISTTDNRVLLSGNINVKSNYSLFACLSVMIWDVLESLPEDVRLLTEHKFRFPTIVYYISRLSTLAFLIVCCTNLEPRCDPTLNAFWLAFLALHRGSTSVLLYLRVHALYRSTPLIRAFFILMLLGIFATSCIYNTHDVWRYSMNCFNLMYKLNHVKVWILVIMIFVFDVFVFVAITYKVMLLGSSPMLPNSTGNSSGMGWKWMIPFRREPLRWLAGRFLRDSLAYFLLTVVAKIPQVMIMPLAGADPSWPTILRFPDIVFTCILSGKIYRDMKLGLPGVLTMAPTTHVTFPTISFFKRPEINQLDDVRQASSSFAPRVSVER